MPSMKLLAALATALALTAAPAAAERGLRLVEHAPALRLDRGGAPSFAGRRPGGPARWSGLALPGSVVRLLVSPVSPDAELVLEIEGMRTEEGGGRIPCVWDQSPDMIPAGRSETVAELLLPPEGPAPPATARPLHARLVEYAVPARARGPLELRLLVDGRERATLRVEVLEALPRVAPDPVLAFLRGRLGAVGGTAWPERVSEEQLLRDLRKLRGAGVTHVTWYGRLEHLERARELWREAGFDTEPLLVGWWPGSFASATEKQQREALERVRELRVSPEGRPRAFWVIDEPVGAELLLARKRARVVREGGGLSTASVQVETAHALRHELDLHLIDNYLSEPAVLDEAVRSLRAAGRTPWGYWQSFGESERFARWNAGFRQLAEPTRGQAFYGYAHVFGRPLDDFDLGYKDMTMVSPVEGELVETLQWVGLEEGLADLRLARAAQALVREERLAGRDGAAVRSLERALERAQRRWSAARSRWGRYHGGIPGCWTGAAERVG